ncbi:MAG TPA: hypothetical protein VGL87_12060 [Steroidobacteraceae bacterium]
MSKLVALITIMMSLGGCATTVTSYVPSEGQTVAYEQGVGTITARTADATVMMYPTFRYQSPSEIPTFTLMVQNTTNHDIDFNPETLSASVDSQQCHVYSLEERVSEIRRAARRKQIALAIAGGLAAAGAGYAASHQTATYTNVGYVGNRSFYSSGTVSVYDPAAGIFAGAAVGAATGVGIHQIAKAAGYEEQAAQGIFQRTTIHPGATVVGQIELKTPSNRFAAVNINVPVDGAASEVQFLKKDTP